MRFVLELYEICLLIYNKISDFSPTFWKRCIIHFLHKYLI
jgi:hypothetical protein